MPDEKDERPTQHTEKGYEIPIPSKSDFFRDLEKVAKPPKRPSLLDRLRRPKEK